MNAVVLLDQPLSGVAERLSALPPVDDEQAAVMIQAGLERDGMTVPVERGFPQSLRRAIERIRGRRLVDDLGQISVPFEILALHVPPGGKAALEFRGTSESERQVSIKALGFGFGNGRRLTVALREGIGQRASCMEILQHVVLHVRRFAVGGDPADLMVTADVIGYATREMRALPNCPRCGPNPPDPFTFEDVADETLDLRDYDTEVTREQAYTLAGDRETDLALAVPVPGGAAVNAGCRVTQHTTVSCTVSYTFPPRKCFVPYRRLGVTQALPYWSVR